MHDSKPLFLLLALSVFNATCKKNKPRISRSNAESNNKHFINILLTPESETISMDQAMALPIKLNTASWFIRVRKWS